MLCFSHLLFLVLKLSHKTQELQQKTAENEERLKEVEELKEQLENRESKLHTVEKEKTLITEKLQQTLVEVKTLTQEKDDQKQLQESLQIERDQLKSDIQDTINMVRFWLMKLWNLRASLKTLKEPSCIIYDQAIIIKLFSLSHILMKIIFSFSEKEHRHPGTTTKCSWVFETAPRNN